jgi:hypothetical protein
MLQLNIAARLPPDVRQGGYTPNVDQAVPAAYGARLDALAREIAARAVKERLLELAPCASKPNAACTQSVVKELATRAFRRPLSAEEHTRFTQAVDGEVASGRGFAAGVELLLTALLESPSFLYLTELGAGGAPGSVVELEAYELASLLAFTVRGGPPDAELLDAAAAGKLSSPDERERQARRLLSLNETRYHFRQFVLEWLEVDKLSQTAKSMQRFPAYEDLKPRMLAETQAFVDEVMVTEGASVRALLGGGFASVDPNLARFYGLRTWGPRASLSGTRRAGLLQQGSFLAAHAYEDTTSPVKRGDFVLRKLLCKELPRPSEIGLEVVMPAPSTQQTTRERFNAHIQDPSCSACHQTLDALGFAFEGFDAMGGARSTENGKAINSSGKAKLAGHTVEFKDSFALTEWLSEAPEVSECFARQAFRYFSAQSDARVEQSFFEVWHSMAPERRDNLLEALIVYVRSDLFAKREVRT